MEKVIDFDSFTNDRIVYVKAVSVDSLPKELQEQVSEDELYAIHSADGERIALVEQRNLAFIVARQNEYAPVSVH